MIWSTDWEDLKTPNHSPRKIRVVRGQAILEDTGWEVFKATETLKSIYM